MPATVHPYSRRIDSVQRYIKATDYGLSALTERIRRRVCQLKAGHRTEEWQHAHVSPRVDRLQTYRHDVNGQKASAD